MKQFFLILFSLGVFLAYGQTPVAKHGKLKVVGSHVVNKNNEKISLAGNSLFWSNYTAGSKFYNKATVDHIAQNWNSSIVRAAMGVEVREAGKPNDDGYIYDIQNGNYEQRQKVEDVINAAIDNGIYVIIDWHSHKAENYKQQAIDFFTYMAQKYGNKDNVIYEIYNEPINTSWSNIKSYSEDVIRAIRSKDPDNLIIVGTRNWSKEVEEVTKIDDVNVAYALHFYALSHKKTLRDKALRAMNKGIPIFITEWGMSHSSGGGGDPDSRIDYGSTGDWMEFCKTNFISHVNWSLSDVHEASAAINNSAGFEGLRTDNLRAAGREAKKIIKGWNVTPVPVDNQGPPDTGSDSNVSIYARGNCGGEEMQLSINGTLVKTWGNVSSTERSYSYTYNGGAINTIKIAFTNDGGGSCGDLNLYVNKVVIGNTTYETETAANRAEGCGNAEWLWCNGHFLFSNLSSNPGPSSNAINIYARGNCGGEEMQLSINGAVVKTWGNVSSTERSYSYTYNGGAIYTIRIAFTNDGGGSCGDLNLYVNKVVIGNTTLETENSANRDEGCGNAEWLWCNGYFTFGNLNLKLATKSEQNILTLSPNPLTTNSLNITLSGLKEPTDIQVSIYSIDGLEMYSKPVLSSGEIHLTDVHNLNTGIYMVRVVADNFQQSARLSVK